METTPSHSLADIALRKIGRNVVNLQKLEGMLKTLVMNSHLEGHTTEIQSQLNKLRKSVSNRSMGIVAGDFFRKIYSEPTHSNESKQLKEPWMSFKFWVEADEKSIVMLQEAFVALVEERNFLIHQKLINVDLNSQSACEELIPELDAQNDRIRPIFEYLKGLLERLTEMKSAALKALEEEWSQDEYADT